MPTYEYVCDACEHSFELYHSIKDEAKKKCPECGKNKLRRMIGPGAAIVFKGSGFYTTDYRSESYKKAAAADKPPTTSASAEKSGESGGAKKEASAESSGGKKEKGESGSAKKESGESSRGKKEKGGKG